MIPLILKEIREHAKWAALWLVGFGLAMAYAVASSNVVGPGGSPLLAPAFQIVTIIGSAAAGLLLGLLQTLPEARRDRWGFLVHRPVSRTALFFGKVLGGLTLYFPALLLPLLAAAVWTATPGNVAAPFDARSALPAVADAVGGVTFYFAGLLIGLRPARWLGSRALPLGAAILCTAGAVGVQPFGLAVSIHVLGVLVLGLAAWGSFIVGGEYTPQPRRARVALTVVVLCGVLLAGGGAVFAIVATLHRPSEAWRSLTVLADGRVVWVTYEAGLHVREVVDVQTGRPIEPLEPLLEKHGTLTNHLNPTLITGRSGFAGYRDPEHYAIQLPVHRSEAWYFVPRLGLARGYDRLTRRHVGDLGLDGFVPPGTAAARHFPRTRPIWIGWGVPPALLAFEDAVYAVDIEQRAVSVFRQGPVRGIGVPRYGNDQKIIVLADAQGLEFRTPGGELQFAVPYHLDPRRYSEILVYNATTAGAYVVHYVAGYDLPRAVRDEWIVTVDAAGHEVGRVQIPPMPPLELPPWREAAVIGLAPPLLLAIPAGIGVWLNLHYDTGQAFTLAALTELFDVVPDSAVLLVIGVTVLAALASAVLTLCFARRYRFTHRRLVGWTIWSLLLGPAGLLTLLAVLDWPAREKCPACGAENTVDRAQCAACEAPLVATLPVDPAAVFD